MEPGVAQINGGAGVPGCNAGGVGRFDWGGRGELEEEEEEEEGSW